MCVCVDFGGLWHRTRGGTPLIIIFYLIVEYVRHLNLLNGRISLVHSALFHVDFLNLIVLFQRRMSSALVTFSYISFHVNFRYVQFLVMRSIALSARVPYFWPFLTDWDNFSDFFSMNNNKKVNCFRASANVD